MKTEEFSEKGVGGGSIREHLNNEGLQKKGGLRPIRRAYYKRGVLERGLFERLQWKFRLQVD